MAINILTAMIAYFCAKDYSKSRHIGFFGAILYTLAPYRLTCVFVRGAVGEYTAMAFIPLVFYGLYNPILLYVKLWEYFLLSYVSFYGAG